MKNLLIAMFSVAALGIFPFPASAMLSADQLEKLCLNRHLNAGTPEFNACVAQYYSTPDAVSPPSPASYVDSAFERRSAECQSYGARPGSQVYVNCMVQLSSRDAGIQQQREQAEQADEARRQELEFQRRAALANMIRNSFKPIPPISIPPPAQRPLSPSLSCTSNAIGQYTYTNCH